MEGLIFEPWFRSWLLTLSDRELDRVVSHLESEVERYKMAKTTPASAKVAAKAAPAKAPPAKVPHKTVATAAPAAPPPPPADPVAAKLAQMKARWAQGREAAKTVPDFGEGTTLNDGKHACRLTEAKIWTDNTVIKVIFKFTKVEGDDQIGETAEKWDGTDTDEGMMYLLRDLTRLGIEELDQLEPEQLPDICAALTEAKPAVKISVKTNANGYKNCYIDKLINLEGDGTIPDAPAAEGDASASDPTLPEEPVAEGDTGEPAEPEPEAGEGEVAEPEGDAGEVAEPEPEPEPEVIDTIDKGDEVSYRYRDPATKQVVNSSGMVRRLIGEDKVEVKDDNTNKLYTFPLTAVQKLALPAE